MCCLGVSLHVSPLREESLFPAALWMSWTLALLVSKARCLGAHFSSAGPRLGVPEVGHQPFASRDKLCICESPPNCVSPHQMCLFWWEHTSAFPPYIDLFNPSSLKSCLASFQPFFKKEILHVHVCVLSCFSHVWLLHLLHCRQILYLWATGEATIIPYVGVNLMCPWEEVNSGVSYTAVLNLFCYLFVKTHLHSQIELAFYLLVSIIEPQMIILRLCPFFLNYLL